MGSALENAGLAPDTVDYVNAHGTGTLANDPAKPRTAPRLWQSWHIPCRYPRPNQCMVMHWEHRVHWSWLLRCFPFIPAWYRRLQIFTEPDESCDLDYVPNQARAQQVNVAISNSFAFGGLNVVLAIRSFPRASS